MHIHHNPTNIAGPHGEYSFGVEVAPSARLLSIAGQVGTRADGSTPESIEEQVEWTFRNILAVLEAADMDVEDLIGMTSYLTNQDYFQAYREAKARMIGAARPTSTLIVVPALALPEWKVEISSWAAKA